MTAPREAGPREAGSRMTGSRMTALRLRLPRLDPRWWMLALAVVAGAVAAWAAQRHLQTLAARLEAAARQPMQSVVVAAVDLPAGTLLDVQRVAVRDMPREWLPADALLPEDFDAAQGALLGRAVRRGDPILAGFLERQAVHQPFSSQLAAGRRAVTIPVDEISSLSGMLEPGDLIDLYVSFLHEQRRVTAPLLQGVRVLATGHQRGEHDAAEGYGRGYATVTLDASPEDAVRLVAARQQGSISAMLRHAGDAQPATVQASGDLATLLGIAPQAPTRPRDVPVIFGDRGPLAIPGLNDADGASRFRQAQDELARAGDDGFAEDLGGMAARNALDAHRAPRHAEATMGKTP